MKKGRAIVMSLALLSCNVVRADTIWIEAEEAYSKSAFMSPIPFVGNASEGGIVASNNSVLQLQTNREGPHVSRYDFAIEKPGKYRIWAATTPLTEAWASVFQFKVDGEYIDIDGAPSGEAYGDPTNPALFQWRLLVEKNFDAGEHNFEFEVTERRSTVDESSSEGDFSFLADAIVVTDKHFIPDGPTKPKNLER